MEKPATRASPEEGANSVVSILIVVVLPAPLEPSKPKTSPALTERVRASTAVNAPKRRVRALISRTRSLIENRRGRESASKQGPKYRDPSYICDIWHAGAASKSVNYKGPLGLPRAVTPLGTQPPV